MTIQVLKNRQKIEKFRVITGYSSGTFIEKVLRDCHNVAIELYIGMALQGISKIDHLKYLKMSTRKNIKIYYVYELPYVHQKIIEVYNRSGKKITYVGSANFSGNGFGKQMELLTTVSDDLDSIFESVRQRAILCNNSKTLETIPLINVQENSEKEIERNTASVAKKTKIRSLLQCNDYLRVPIIRREWGTKRALNAEPPYLDLYGTNYNQFFDKNEVFECSFKKQKFTIYRQGDFGKKLYFKDFDIRAILKQLLNIESEFTFEKFENIWILFKKTTSNEYNLDIIVNIDGSDEYFTLD